MSAKSVLSCALDGAPAETSVAVFGTMLAAALDAGALDAGALAEGAAVAAEAVTVMDPSISGWISQKYSYVPAVSNVNEKVPSVFRVPESNDAGPLVDVAVCGAPSRLVHVTVSPTSMVRLSLIHI